MGLYAGSNSAWIDDIYQFEETDVVQGGPTGIDNVPLKNLADRTAWLKAQIGRANRLEGQEFVNSSVSIPATKAGYLIAVHAAAVITVSLGDVATFPHGSILPFSAACNAGCVVNIQPVGGQLIAYPDSSFDTVIHMHHKEQIIFVALTNHWKVISPFGNFFCAGEETKSRKLLLNALPLQGQILSRASYPRLWKFAQSLTTGQEIVSEATWLSDINYKGLFTDGDGVSTFRLPDERGMFERMLDLGRGIDVDRMHNYPGGYEADELLQHGHGLKTTNSDRTNNSGADPVRGALGGDINLRGQVGANKSIDLTGGSENRPKNIGKIFQIKY